VPASLPSLPQSLGDQRVAGRSLEIRALPALLQAGINYLERTLLSSSALDRDDAAYGRNTVSLCGVPLQLRKFQEVQGEVFLAASDACGTGADRETC